MELLGIILFGLLIGYLGGYAGISGAPFFIAFLVMGVGFQQHLAQGTVLAVMLGPMSLPAVWAFRQRFLELWKYILAGVLLYALFSYVGAAFAFSMDEKILKVTFGCLLMILGISQIRNSKKQQATSTPRKHRSGFWVCGNVRFPINLLTVGAVGAIVGIFGGLFGIGAGVIMLPFFVNGLHIHKNDARLLGLAILLPPVSIGAVIKYQQNASIDWHIAAILLLAYLATNFFGAKRGQKASPAKFAVRFGIILITLGCLMFSFPFFR